MGAWMASEWVVDGIDGRMNEQEDELAKLPGE